MGKKKKKAQNKRLERLKEILEIIAQINGIISSLYTLLKG